MRTKASKKDMEDDIETVWKANKSVNQGDV